MPTEDPEKLDVSKQSTTTENATSPQLSDDDLKSVSGGLNSRVGTTLPSSVCISEL